jgi:hypothetical protein
MVRAGLEAVRVGRPGRQVARCPPASLVGRSRPWPGCRLRLVRRGGWRGLGQQLSIHDGMNGNPVVGPRRLARQSFCGRDVAQGSDCCHTEVPGEALSQFGCFCERADVGEAALLEASVTATPADPLDSPNRATFWGSPPKAALSCTRLRLRAGPATPVSPPGRPHLQGRGRRQTPAPGYDVDGPRHWRPNPLPVPPAAPLLQAFAHIAERSRGHKQPILRLRHPFAAT